MNREESCEISVSKISKYLEEDIPVINHSTDHIDRSNIVVNPQTCFSGFPLAKSSFLQESRSKHQGQIGGSHTVAKNLGKTKQKVVDSKVVMKVIQMKTSFYSCFPLPLFLWLFLSYILPHTPQPQPSLPFPRAFYQLSINANGVLAVLSDFMQGLQQTLQSVTVAGWHQVNQQLQGRKLILWLQSYRKGNKGWLRGLDLATA